MRPNIKATFLSLIVSAFVLVPIAYAVPGTWRGFASTDGSLAANGVMVDAYLNNVTKSSNSTVGEISTWPTGYYLVNVVGTSEDKVNFKICGITVAIPSQDWSEGLHNDTSGSPYINLSVSKLANGASCTYSCGCTGGHCCSGSTEYTLGEGTGTCQSAVCSGAETTTTTAGGVSETTTTTVPGTTTTTTVPSTTSTSTTTTVPTTTTTIPLEEILRGISQPIIILLTVLVIALVIIIILVWKKMVKLPF